MSYMPLAKQRARENWQLCFAASAAPGHLLAGGINQTMAKKSPKKPTKAKPAKAKKSPAKHVPASRPKIITYVWQLLPRVSENKRRSAL